MTIPERSFLELTHCGTFADYISEKPSADINVAKQFITDKSLEKILLIRGDAGNGKTHLFSAIINELISNDIKCASLSNEGIVDVYLRSRNRFEEYISICDYILIDSITCVITKKETFNWLINILMPFFNRGCKVVFTSDLDISVQEILNYFYNIPVCTIETTFPSYQTLFSIALLHFNNEIIEKYDAEVIALLHFNNEIIEKYAAEAISESHSVREFLGRIVITRLRDVTKFAQLDF